MAMRIKMLNWSWFVGAVAVLSLCGMSSAQMTKYEEDQRLNMESHVDGLTGHAIHAKGNYRRYCVGCHGEEGDGEGENAQWVDPKPRNFTLGQFKCRSTPSGTLPTDEDLYNSIGRGFDRSVMPSWNTLTKQERADLVAWVKHFSAKWTTDKAGTPIQIPPEPEITADRVKAGQVLFQKLECWKCHGVEGRANGPSSDTLTDDQNRPIKAYNFAEGSRPKCGSADEDIYRIFMTGLDGTPMPSFADNVKPDEAWDLVFYLRTLQPFKTKERLLAKQLGLKPINPSIPLPAAPAAPPAAETAPSAAPAPSQDNAAPATPPAPAPQQ
jgi:cytochrome c oxidase cbb3-type subunit 2